MLKGCIVTLDAMGCQTAIAEQIVAQKADYVLSVKQNQGHLYQHLESMFTLAEDSRFPDIRTYTIVDGGIVIDGTGSIGNVEADGRWEVDLQTGMVYLGHQPGEHFFSSPRDGLFVPTAIPSATYTPRPTDTPIPTPTPTPTDPADVTATAYVQAMRASLTGKLVFNADGGRLIASRSTYMATFVVNADGTEKHRLTLFTEPRGFGDGMSVWTADGQIMYLSERRDNQNGRAIYLMQADGSGEQLFASFDSSVSGFALSPDGQQLVVDKTILSSRDQSRIAWLGMDVSMPDWSPDGSRLVFVSEDDNYHEELVSMPVTDGKDNYQESDLQALFVASENTDRTRLAYPVWSPDGRYIAFNSSYRSELSFCIVDTQSGENQQPRCVDTGMDDFGGGLGGYFKPAWSPDGRFIAYAASDGIDVLDVSNWKSFLVLGGETLIHSIDWLP